MCGCILLSPSNSVLSSQCDHVLPTKHIHAAVTNQPRVPVQTARASFLVRRQSSTLAWVICTLCRGWRIAMSGAVLVVTYTCCMCVMSLINLTLFESWCHAAT